MHAAAGQKLPYYLALCMVQFRPHLLLLHLPAAHHAGLHVTAGTNSRMSVWHRLQPQLPLNVQAACTRAQHPVAEATSTAGKPFRRRGRGLARASWRVLRRCFLACMHGVSSECACRVHHKVHAHMCAIACSRRILAAPAHEFGRPNTICLPAILARLAHGARRPNNNTKHSINVSPPLRPHPL